jgi:uncharacterized membrane protein YgdD (TMEM256/DUF423 family)
VNHSALFLFIASASGLLAVALGAFGAHGLKEILSIQQLITWETAVRYQMWHALALGLISQLLNQHPSNKLLIRSGWLMAVGTLFFSGSLYALCLTGYKWFGPITPIGGLLLLTGWLFISLFALKRIKHV